MSIIEMPLPPGAAPPKDNIVQPFRVETLELKGQLVRLGSVVHDILHRHEYPAPVAALLAEALTLTACLANSLKFDGKFRFHTQTNGPVPMIVCDVTNEGNLRGYAEVADKTLSPLSTDEGLTLQEIMGTGHLAFTVDSPQADQRYQGIVEVSGASLTDCVHHYFQQSAQLDTTIKYAGGIIEEEGDVPAHWRTAAIMLQRLPPDDVKYENADKVVDILKTQKEVIEENWRRSVILLSSATEEEMLSPDLAATDLIYRLFNEDGVRAYEAVDLKDQCTCDKSRMESVIKSLSETEIDELSKDGIISITCQFCNRTREYNEHALADLRQHKD